MESVRNSELRLRNNRENFDSNPTNFPSKKKRKKSVEIEWDETADLNQNLEFECQDTECEEENEVILEEALEEEVVETEAPTYDENTENNLQKEEHLENKCIHFVNYVLNTNEENGQKSVSVRAVRRKETVKDSYEFNVISHSNTDCIYSCEYCVKAFGNLELLMKHLSTCHVCQLCLHISSNYNDLNIHHKTHQENISCPFCESHIAQKSFRQHIKKKHIPNIPNYYALLID